MSKGNWNKAKAAATTQTAADLWQSILEPWSFGDAEFRESKERDPRIFAFGLSEAYEVARRLLAILGPDAVSQTDQDFCQTSQCPPEKLDEWLAQAWVQHHARNVARLKETAGPFPLLLRRGGPGIFVLEIWSLKEAPVADTRPAVVQ
jgi:hypothetical protein